MNTLYTIVVCANTEAPVKKLMDYLLEKQYSVTFTKTEPELLQTLKTQMVNLVVLELDFIPKDGISMTSDIRNLKEIEQPYLIIFSDKADDYVQITAFNAGADDFILTPLKPILIDAKIASLKKRFKHQDQAVKSATASNFVIDKEQYVIINKNQKISLPRKEFEMLYLMYQQLHKVFTRQDFAKLIWNSPEVANSRTIDIHIRNIRKIVGEDIIKTVKGIGYRFNQEAI